MIRIHQTTLLCLFFAAITAISYGQASDSYLAYAHLSETSFKDLKHADPNTLTQLPFALPGFEIAFSEDFPMRLTLSASYDGEPSAAMIQDNTQKNQLQEALTTAYGTTYITLSATQTQSTGRRSSEQLDNSIFLATTDQTAWEDGDLGGFQYPVIEIVERTPDGEPIEHSITFYPPLAFEGYQDYYSRYGWQTNSRIPLEHTQARRDFRLKGAVATVTEYLVDSATTFSQRMDFTLEGLRTGMRKWDASIQLVWIEWMTDVSWHENGALAHASIRDGLVEANNNQPDLSVKGEFRWDEHGAITAKRYSEGTAFANYQPTYNAQGNLEVWQGGAQETTYQYAEGLIVQQRQTVADLTNTVSYTYDAKGRIVKIRNEVQGGQVEITDIAYDDIKGTRLESYSKYTDAGLQSKIMVEQMVYNHHGHPVEHIHAVSGNLAETYFRRYTYSYDAQGNWTRRTTEDVWDQSETFGQTLEVLTRDLTYFEGE